MCGREDGIRAFYDATAEAWERDWYDNEAMLPQLRWFLGRLPPSPRVLDLGCGAGYESMRLARLGARVVGVDISEGSLAIARRRNPGIVFHNISLLALEDSLGAFDGVAAIASLVHIPREELAAAFRGIRGRLVSGGHLWASFREGDGYDAGRSKTVVGGVEVDRHFYGHRPDGLIEAAAACGLSFVEAFGGSAQKLGAGGWLDYLFQAT